MLNIENFHKGEEWEFELFYEGVNHYFIFEHPDCITLLIEKIIDGDIQTECHDFVKLSEAVAMIEKMEE
jgi:hypothetical protein